MATRRQVLFGAAAGLLAPSVLGASNSRRFLFVFANGGWDPTVVFAPEFANPNVDMPEASVTATVGGLSFVDSGNRPSVRRLFEGHAANTAILNGLEVRSVAHERCRRLILTGTSSGAADDWPAILAHSAGEELLMPHVVASGPSFTSAFSSEVVRVGSGSQLPDLLDHPADDATEAWLLERARGREGPLARAYEAALTDARATAKLGLQFGEGDLLLNRVDTLLDAFARGSSRCAMVRHDGLWDQTFDSHAANFMQSEHFELLFSDLDGIADRIAARGLQDEVCVVVFSEMGRHPQLNNEGGKHHWTATSAMLFGAGVQGGRVVGGFTDEMTGRYRSADLGATLLALGDVDPGAWTDGEVISELLG